MHLKHTQKVSQENTVRRNVFQCDRHYWVSVSLMQPFFVTKIKKMRVKKKLWRWKTILSHLINRLVTQEEKSCSKCHDKKTWHWILSEMINVFLRVSFALKESEGFRPRHLYQRTIFTEKIQIKKRKKTLHLTVKITWHQDDVGVKRLIKTWESRAQWRRDCLRR